MIAIALASPHITTSVEIQGDPTLTILYDNSTSFDIYRSDSIDLFINEVRSRVPVTVRNIAEGEVSALGDSILSQLRGGESVLLITDGNNNYGRSFGDMISFASVPVSYTHLTLPTKRIV